MIIRQHVHFRTDKAPDLVQYLNANCIIFEKSALINSLAIDESNPHWPVVYDYVCKYHLFCTTETIYSKKELSSAEWLHIWCSWRNGYPQPEKKFGYEETTYSKELYCDNCGCGLKQTGLFSIKKTPNWGKRHFMELNWIGDELFVSNHAKDILQSYSFSGMTFKHVASKNGVSICEDVNQIEIAHLLEWGIDEKETLFKKVADCPKCRKRKYVLSGRSPIAYQREVFLNAPDIVKTKEFFGDGQYAARLILVRQKVYQALIENQLDRNLIFEPIQLI